MNIKDTFLVTSGSVPGRHHLGHHPNLVGSNNQDASARIVTDDYAVFVVSDGCGSGEYSEFGSRLLVRCAVNAFSAALSNPVSCYEPFSPRWLQTCYHYILGDVREVVDVLTGTDDAAARNNFVASHLLATLVVAIATPETTMILTIGDGVFALNDKVSVVDSGADNAPDYIAYGLMGGAVAAQPGSFRFTVQAQLPTSNVDSLLIGSDGIGDLIEKEAEPLPGKPEEVVGPLSWFWSAAAFKNSVKVERRLRLINREVVRVRPDGSGVETQRGLLSDDTTLIALRRKGSNE